MSDQPKRVTVCRGKTYPLRAILNEFGFRWDGKAKLWIHDPPIDQPTRELLMTAFRRCDDEELDLQSIEVRDIREEWL